jgi:hypothetical protein
MRALSLELLRETGQVADSVLASMVTGEADLDRIALWLDTVLDESYVLLRNVDLPRGHTAIDFLVAGPGGVWALYVEADPGQFKSEDGAFYTWESQNAGYVRIDPNPLLILQSNLTQIRSWLKDNRLPPDCARTAILFTDSAAVVESTGDDVALVGPQLVEAYPVQIAQAPAVLDARDVERFALAVANGKLPPPPPLALAGTPERGSLSLWQRFERRQLVVLGVLAFLDVFVLGAFCVWAVFLYR